MSTNGHSNGHSNGYSNGHATLSQDLMAQVVAFFEQDDWPFRLDEARSVLRTAFQSKQGQWQCSAHVLDERRFVVFYSTCPTNAPEERRGAVMEFVTRANYGMYIGDFELDLSDGEVRYKTSVAMADGVLTFDMMRDLVYANISTMNRYMPGLLQVMFGGVDPAKAVAEIEAERAPS